MVKIEDILHRMSPFQLRALFALSKAKNGLISSVGLDDQLGKKGKALGGVFSSLIRRKINGESLVLPWGKSEDGRGLRWKLNEKLITRDKLLKITKELLG